MQKPHRLRFPVAALSLLSAVLYSYAAPSSPGSLQPAPVTITEKNGGKMVTVKVGTKIEVQLPSNASTGYSWILDQKDVKSLVPAGKPEYINGKSEMPGAPGTQVWHFKAAKRAKLDLKFRYVRLWEKNVAPAKVWKVTIKINRI